MREDSTSETDKPYRFATPTRTTKESVFIDEIEAAARESRTSYVEKFANFPLWAPRQNVARFLAQYEIYRNHILPIHGSIIEGGVCFGGGLMAWAHLVSIFEPVNHTRRVIGFDTFEGFPGLSEADEKAESGMAYAGGMAAPLDEELAALAALHDTNRAVGHIPRVELVKGDANKTIPQYVKDNPHLIVAALVLDFDIFDPTWVALSEFAPLMPRGGVVIFDELNCKDWPGETRAVMAQEVLRLGKLQRFPYASTLSYLVIE